MGESEQGSAGGGTIGVSGSEGVSLGATIRYCKCNKLECVATALSVIGGFFNPLLDEKLRLTGFVLWFGGNILWLRFAHAHGKWGMFLMQFMFSVQNFAGIINMLFLKV